MTLTMRLRFRTMDTLRQPNKLGRGDTSYRGRGEQQENDTERARRDKRRGGKRV